MDSGFLEHFSYIKFSIICIFLQICVKIVVKLIPWIFFNKNESTFFWVHKRISIWLTFEKSYNFFEDIFTYIHGKSKLNIIIFCIWGYCLITLQLPFKFCQIFGIPEFNTFRESSHLILKKLFSSKCSATKYICQEM